VDADDLLGSLLWALPFFALAGALYAYGMHKQRRGRRLHARAQELLSGGDREQARATLLQSLWNANETPELERRILADLAGLYRDAGVSCDLNDYDVLVRQYEQLAKKHSQKALLELRAVQGLKRQLIDRMPRLA